jgi:two-component system response regulator YesN
MKLMIIDDDVQIREGLQEGVDWVSLGISQVKSYRDALKALDDLDDFSPDIILSDVRMPGKDGLSFLKIVKEKHPAIKVIMISAYSDFEYVQKALKHGALDYELKPIKFQRLISLMRNTVKLIIKERSESELNNEYFKQYKLSFFRKALLGKVSFDEKNTVLFEQQFPFSVDCVYCCLNLNVTYLNGIRNQTLPLRFQDTIQEEFSSHFLHYIYFEKDNQAIVILEFKHTEISDILKSIKGSVHYLDEQLLTDHIHVSGGVEELHSLHDLPQAYEKANSLVKYTSCTGPGTVVHDSDLHTNLETVDERLRVLEGKVVSSFINIEKAEMIASIKSIGVLLYEQQEFRHEVYKEIVTNCQIMIKNKQEVRFFFEEGIMEKIASIFYLNDFIEYWIETFSFSLDGMIKFKNLNLSSMTMKSLDFINTHYKENINANDVARYINKSPNYFSSIFKKEFSMSFKEYLNKLRIDEAEKLIKEGNLYIYEIAYQVGFKDYSYFYQVFKRVNGYEPTQLKA